MKGKLTFAYPGDLNLNTGGYRYDRKVVAELRQLGWTVDLLPLGDGFPFPSNAQKSDAETRLSALPDGTLLMVDGLAYGVLKEWAERESNRLHIIALVHHPLALETGLDASLKDTLRASEEQALSYAEHVVVTSPGTARELIENFAVPESGITVALPGTDRAPVSACNGNPPHIVSIGTLIPRKAHDVLIDALKRVENLPWNATIVGSKNLDPATANALDEQVNALGLADRVVLAGELDDARTLLATGDIFALASRYEGYGMVFAEALSQGVPIVACRAGAIPDVVPDTAGFLVPVDDVGAFSQALRILLEDKGLHARMAQAARKAGEKLPGWNETASIISNVMERF